MRISQLLSITLRQTSQDAELASHQLLLRAGYMRQLSAGIFSMLHLGHRSLQKIEQVLREEMDAIGGVEISMPVVHPAEIWQLTGRYDAIDDSLVRFNDRSERPLVLAMTHEEVVASLVATEVSTYKQLPLLVYQIQTKFRDELRSRGGLIRVREFRMKDSYSLDSSWEGLEKQYIAHYDAYFRIMARCGLPVVAVTSDVGMMGGRMAHEFMYLAPIGEDSIFICDKSGEKANKEVARMAKPEPAKEAAKELDKVHTPGTKTIEDLAAFLKIDAAQTAKVVFYTAELLDEEEPVLVLALVRGDLEVNEVSVKNALQAKSMRVATEDEIRAAGCEPGYASPIGIKREGVKVLVDDLITTTPNLVTGANEPDFHYRHANYGRDFEADIVADITAVFHGAPSPFGGTWQLYRGVEVGNIFQLGTKYTEGLNGTFMNEQGRPEPVIMGSYGIGVGRLLACVVEEHHDEDGLKLPISVAPYQVSLVSLADGEETETASEELYQRLTKAGVEVLYDDRHKKMAGPGIKFKDSDLLGLPIRLTVSKKTLAEGAVELKLRHEADKTLIPIEEVIPRVEQAIDRLYAELSEASAKAERWG